MNFIFISPNFPHTYWNFCDRLKRNGVNVLGIGDAPYDGLEDGLKGALTEYHLRTMTRYSEQSLSSPSSTERSTGSNPSTSTGWSRMRACARISTSQQVFRRTASALSRRSP